MALRDAHICWQASCFRMLHSQAGSASKSVQAQQSCERARWLVSSTREPLSIRYLSVGMAARMRVSSVMFRSLSSGTFRSARTCAGGTSPARVHQCKH